MLQTDRLPWTIRIHIYNPSFKYTQNLQLCTRIAYTHTHTHAHTHTHTHTHTHARTYTRTQSLVTVIVTLTIHVHENKTQHMITATVCDYTCTLAASIPRSTYFYDNKYFLPHHICNIHHTHETTIKKILFNGLSKNSTII